MNERKPSKARRKPETVTVGLVTVTIYRRTRPTVIGGTRTIWEVANYVNGRRRLTSFSEHALAIAEAQRIAGLLSTGQSNAANLRADEAAEYGNAIAILRNANLETSLQTVADRYVEAVKILRAENIVKAAEFFIQRKPCTRPIAEQTFKR